jgi:hypothetical protein
MAGHPQEGGGKDLKKWDDARELPNNPEHWSPDPSDLYVEAPETGDGAPISGRVSLQDKALVQQAVQSGRFRFRTEAELVRTFVVLGLIQYVRPTLEENSPEARSLAHRAALMRAAAVANEGAMIANFVKQVRRSVNDCAVNGLSDRIPRMVADMILEIRKEAEEDWAVAAERGVKDLPRVSYVWAEVELLLEKGVPRGTEL